MSQGDIHVFAALDERRSIYFCKAQAIVGSELVLTRLSVPEVSLVPSYLLMAATDVAGKIEAIERNDRAALAEICRAEKYGVHQGFAVSKQYVTRTHTATGTNCGDPISFIITPNP